MLAWKQSLVYISGLVLIVFGIVALIMNLWFGILVEVAGFSLLVWNLISVIKSDQTKAVKVALIVPKAIVMLILFIIVLFSIVGTALS